ncbi:MAG: hypothetical protein QM756_30935 [Polyangiaceae bacterium]
MLGGVEQRQTRAVEVRLLVGEERRLLDQGARALVRGVGHPHQALQHLAQVFVGLAALDDGHEALERLAKLGVAVDRREVILRGGGLVAEALFEHSYFMEQQRLQRGVVARVVLGA